jgi:hypothetical protein
MECFRIDWKGPYSLDAVQKLSEARELGLYAVYRLKKLLYIGKSTELGRRIGEHNRGWSHILSERQRAQCSVFVGTIYSYEGSRPSLDISARQLNMVEGFLINELKPAGNSDATKKRYTGTPVIIVNTGKRGLFKKVMSHNTELLSLLKQNISTRVMVESSSSWF